MRTLLLADENITVQRVIALTFAREAFRIVTASDGQQAMDRMAAQKPDIVLAGTTLPYVSGYELARYVRSRPELKHVPVLLLMGAFETVDEAQLRTSGASGVIEKPVEPTIVISRVKELLGLTTEPVAPAPAAGRLVTSAHTAPDAAPRAVTSTQGTPSRWEQLRTQSGLEANARSVEPAPARDEYLDSLESAFDTLDQQLAGRSPAGQPPPQQQRNPSGPLGQTVASVDPRSPGRAPVSAPPPDGNPVYEVDDEWFADGGKAREDARAGRREIIEESKAPELQMPAAAPPPPSTPVYEVDDEWFAEDDKARAARDIEHKNLAAEMGIHEVELPSPAPAPPPVRHPDLESGIEDLKAVAQPPAGVERPAAPQVADEEIEVTAELAEPVEPPPVEPPPVEPARVEAPRVEALQVEALQVDAPRRVEPTRVEAPPVEPKRVEVAPTPAPAPVVEAPILTAPAADHAAFAAEPVARPLPISLWEFGGLNPAKPAKPAEPPAPTPQAPVAPAAPLPPVGPATIVPEHSAGVDLADDFAALLAYEQGEQATPPMVMPIIQTVTPEITGEMLDQIATTVAARLKDSVRIEPLAPEITGGMLEQIAATVAERLKDSLHIEPVAPPMTDDMLAQLAGQVADRLAPNVRVEAKTPEITGGMLDQIAAQVTERIQASVMGDRLRDAINESVRDIVRTVVSETSERLVRDEIARIKSKAGEPPSETTES